ncbi:rab-GTPase-TBC domain-containing protein [Hirsutella rhossiliensis]|uniref:Rab-GTPase-TBC domain-containing protein n=1 Tax=Hirsutella rhossiliensis TaxID=111463 RepID=A0A9P8MTC2_9HYPO|nr:rab-GTPase-TBC domain-containing protein [Hirsutella rhossiliensis]KAH0960870.1 rab-GTPase-TBC domain-containing protein [Hirsutella rhossiliensis]
MASTKSPPSRHKSRPFRDDTTLVALRYEKTKPAEPPVPLPPPRSLLRVASVASTSRLSSSASTQSASSSLSGPSHSPVVVAPPHGYLPGLAPPTEQHPALRDPAPAAARAFDDWKRDSGHAPTATSSATIHEEEEECEDDEDQALRARLKTLADPGPASPAVRQANAVRASWDRSLDLGDRNKTAVAGLGIACAAASRPLDGPSSTLRWSLASRRSSSSLSSSHGRKSSDEDSSGRAAPMHPPSPMRGSATTPAPANNNNSHAGTKSPRPTRSMPATPDTSPSSADCRYSPLAVRIPTASLIDDDFMAGFSFSKRGSIMFGGSQDPLALDGALDDDDDAQQSPDSWAPRLSPPAHVARPVSEVSTAETVARSLLTTPDIRVLSPDVEKESQKVRSLYETGDGINWEDGARHSFCERLEPTPEVPAEEAANDPASAAHLASHFATPRSTSFYSQHQDSSRRETELAGGLEDWEDVDGADVDRYGFISVPRPSSRISTPPAELRSAQLSPRRRNVLQKRDPMGFSSQLGGARVPSRKVSARSLNTLNSELSLVSVRSSRSLLRQAGNLLPHNRNRRWMDEAGDMLTVPPSLQDSAEGAQVDKISEALKRKEWERSEKWRRMAKLLKGADQGQGMEFEFDACNPKLIERTWKGIPDRWRAAAWWSFMASAAEEHDGSAAADDVAAAFHALQEKSSPDDVQIDLDVPRTISRHIMFRRRYRGGQRLLFRVLHALSIYFPDVGYVQGMASLAATLLCYFDEEKCFVMLVRMWQLRGLSRLYRPGFDGLMAALREFETGWLNKDVSDKLSELCIDATAYGTRWYLTLFNLSIPFPAQLRVWDVFLLLGAGGSEGAGPSAEGAGPGLVSGLEVLHATGAALIQALREVLLDSDFENAMKALTSWIPIKDEDLLMKVMKAEWKTRQGKKKP